MPHNKVEQAAKTLLERSETEMKSLSTLRFASALLVQQQEILHEMVSEGEMSIAEADSHFSSLELAVRNLNNNVPTLIGAYNLVDGITNEARM